MNILIFNWRDIKNPMGGGAEIVMLENAQYWHEKGADVTWFTSSFNGAKEQEDINGIHMVRHGSHYTVHLWAVWYFLTGKLGNPDIVIDCFHFIPFFTPLFVKKTKIISIIHEVARDVWYDNIFFLVAVIGYYTEPLFFKLYQGIPFITASKSTEEALIALGIPRKNISLIHNGVTIIRVKKTAREKQVTVLFLGRISKDKGIADAIRAFLEIKKNVKDAKLWIAGKQDKEHALSSLIDSLVEDVTIKQDITYYGFISQEKKFHLLQKAHILLHPSKREGWGLTVIEANAMGTPVVGYNVQGLRDSIRNNETGLLVECTPRGLADGVMHLVHKPSLYKKMSDAAVKWSKNFTWQESAEKSFQLIQSISQYEK